MVFKPISEFTCVQRARSRLRLAVKRGDAPKDIAESTNLAEQQDKVNELAVAGAISVSVHFCV